MGESIALSIIRRAIVESGKTPDEVRWEALPGERRIEIDVPIRGRAYGIAFVTKEEARDLGDALLSPNARNEKLKLLRLGPSGETRVVLLFQANYEYDDAQVSSTLPSSRQAELELLRDARDFVTFAETRGFP